MSAREPLLSRRDFDRLAILDVEASALLADSWPIEIGVALVEGDRITRVEARLIRPDARWDPEAWSDESEALHGIDRATLEDAPAAAEVAGWLLDLTAGLPVLSDAVAWDQAWLEVLLVAGGRPAPALTLLDFYTTLGTRLRGTPRWAEAAQAARSHLDRTPPPHRAGPDANRLATAWCVAMRAS